MYCLYRRTHFICLQLADPEERTTFMALIKINYKYCSRCTMYIVYIVGWQISKKLFRQTRVTMCAKYTNSQPNNAAYNIQQYAVKIDSKRYNLKIKIQDMRQQY